MTDDDLIKYNHLGLIPGPKETEDQFLKRVEYCLHLKENLDERVSAYLSAPASEELSQQVLSEAFELSRQFYDCEPDWVPLMFSNYKLAPWHGGCAWIFQMDEKAPISALLQLRQKFQSETMLYGFYPRKELIAHEIAHIGRMTFEEPQFEEMLAYASSSSWISRILGPILESSKESIYFVLIIAAVFLLNLFLFFQNMFSLGLFLFPLVLAGYGIWRLYKKRRIFNRCLKNLGNDAKAHWIMFRLTDQEICLFSQLTPEQIHKYAEEQQDTSLRWRLIYKSYF